MKTHFLLILTILPLLLVNNVLAEHPQLIILTPFGDTYVGNDLLDHEDKQGLLNLNLGDSEFLKLWYAWHAPGFEENQIISHAYIGFDLSEIPSDHVGSAKLRMFATHTDLAFDSIDVGLFDSDTNWSESSMFGFNASSFNPEPIVMVAVGEANKWYEWDITDTVKDHAGGKISFAVVFGDITDTFEETVEFASNDITIAEIRPVLVIEETTVQLKSSADVDFEEDFIVGIGVGAAIVGIAAIFYIRKTRKLKTKNILTS